MILTVLFTFLAIIAATGFYRIFIHPLRKFPGPRLAAVAGWYQAYWDVVRHGGMPAHVLQLHKQYGPVVRIGPNQLSFCQQDAFDDIFQAKFHRDMTLYRIFGLPKAMFGTYDLKLWKSRRERISLFFSRRAILNLESVVQEKVDLFIQRVTESSQDGTKPVNLALALRCLTLEVISSYVLGKSNGVPALTSPNFRHPYLLGLQQTLSLLWIMKYIPIFSGILAYPPKWLIPTAKEMEGNTEPNSKSMFIVNRIIQDRLDEVLADPHALDDAKQETIFKHMLSEPIQASYHELEQESRSMFQAGSETTALAISNACFYFLHDPQVREKVMKELLEVWPDSDMQVGFQVLEKLPYLTAMIKESLRIVPGISFIIPRVVGPTGAIIAGTHIPTGTTVSSAVNLIHHNEAIFPEPTRFNPDRWLSDNKNELDRSMVAFSKGPTSCLGINLAWCELYLAIGNIFRKLDMTLYETTIEDFTEWSDFGAASYHGRPLQALVKLV